MVSSLEESKESLFFASKFHSIRKRAVCLCVLSEGDEM